MSVLLYADDIALISLTEQDMQRLLDTLHDWCKRWSVLVNTDKSKFVQFRKGRRRRTECVFKVGNNILKLTEKYKYLGVIFTEKGDFNLNAENLTTGGGRALGSIISKLKTSRNLESRLMKNYTVLVLFLYLTNSRPCGATKIIMTLILYRTGPSCSKHR